MKTILASLLLTTILVSCDRDHYNYTRVCNQTGKEIILKITFDSAAVEDWAVGKFEQKNFTRTFLTVDDNLIPVDFDTINYISTYSLRPDSCGQIEEGDNLRPNFNFFKEIEIITAFDTLRLRTKEEMRKAFDADRHDPKYFFDLLIIDGGENASR